MKKVVIFGNSGSGKSTLAKRYIEQEQLAHLDLDTIAWLPTEPPKRQVLSNSITEIDNFILDHEAWVIEGCYGDLLAHAINHCDQVVYLNLSVENCVANAKNRPWEPHKYKSKAEQDKNLAMLINWIEDYATRSDTFSQVEHQRLYDDFSGAKSQRLDNKF